MTATVKAVRDAMDEIVPGPMAVMKWFESEVAKAIKRGEKQLECVHHQVLLSPETYEETLSTGVTSVTGSC